MLSKRFVLLLLPLLATAALLSACTTDPAPTEVELLQSKTWKLANVTASPPVVIGGVTVDVWASEISACDKQQTRKFNADNTITFGTDSSACVPAGFVPNTYTWSLSGTTLNTTEPDGDSGTGIEAKVNTLISISENTMVISWNVPSSASSDGAAHVATETYTAQ